MHSGRLESDQTLRMDCIYHYFDKVDFPLIHTKDLKIGNHPTQLEREIYLIGQNLVGLNF